MTESVKPQAMRCVRLGRIVGLYGVKGWVRVESWTEPRNRIFGYQPWLLESDSTKIEVDGATGRVQGKGLVAQLPGIEDRDQAMALIGCEITVPRSALPAPAPGEYYWTDLEGCEVVTVEGIRLGQISHLLETGANDVMVVRDGERERLIPFIEESYVKQVDLAAGLVQVDWDPEF